MRNLGAALAVACAALVCTAAGGAAVNPSFVVTTTGAAANIAGAVASNDDALAKVEYFVPNGYSFAPTATGKAVGTAVVNVITDIGPNESPLTGKVVSGAPQIGPEFAQVIQGCAGGTHVAQWTISVSGAAIDYQIPAFVDKTSGAEAQLGAYKLVVCFASPELPVGTPGRAPGGARVVSVRLRISTFKAPAAHGDYRWRSLWTPFASGKTTLNAPAAVEAQSVVRAPSTVTIAARKASASRVTISGRVSAATPAGAQVLVYSGPTRSHLAKIGSVRTSASGAYSLGLKLRGTRYVMVQVQTADRDLGASACTASFGPSVKCVAATAGGAKLTSAVVRVSA